MVRVNALRGFVRFGDIVVARRRVDFRQQREVGGRAGNRTVVERERLVAPYHAALVPNAAGECEKAHRHRVQHLVADHHAFESLRQRVQPAHFRQQCGRLRPRSSRVGARAIRPTDPRSNSCRTRRPARRARSAGRRRVCPCPRRIPSRRACRSPAKPRRAGAPASRRTAATIPAPSRSRCRRRRADRICARRRCNSRVPARKARAPCSGRTAASRPHFRAPRGSARPALRTARARSGREQVNYRVGELSDSSPYCK